jgi:hypothetical protein
MFNDHGRPRHAEAPPNRDMSPSDVADIDRRPLRCYDPPVGVAHGIGAWSGR